MPESRQDLDLRVHGYTFKATFMQILNPKHSITAGYQLNGVRSNQLQDMPPLPEDNFRYNDLTNALFAEWKALWSARFSTTLGLRGENLHLSGFQKQNNSDFSKNYPGLYPSLGASLNFPQGDQSLSLNVRRTIHAPSYYMLNPYEIWNSATSYYVGNPDLRPSYEWRFELIYSFLNNWVAGLSWSHEPKKRDNYTFYKDGYTVSSSSNLGKFDAASFFIEYYKSFFERFRVNANARLSHISRRGVIEDAYLSSKATYVNLDLKLHYLISKAYKWRASASAHYSSPDRGLTNDGKANYNLSLQFSKEWRCGLKMTAGISRLIYNYSPLIYSSETYYSSSRSIYRPVHVSFGLSYVFGNMRVSAPDDRNMEIQ